jgi:hypothetical protein
MLRQEKNNGYTVKETADGKLVENKKEGVSMKVDSDWQAEQESLNSGKYQMDLFSPEASAQEEMGEIKRGCKITTTITPQKTNLKDIEDRMNFEVKQMSGQIPQISVKNEIVDISGKKGVKSITDYGEGGISIEVQIPTDDKVYAFIVFPGSSSEEECANAFNDFLRTISIK